MTDLLDRPLFVVGCGRSGTTILGRSIGAHRDVCYLNEPRALWRAAFPESDIWRKGEATTATRLVMGEADARPEAAAALRAAFAEEVRAGGRRRLCEKLPINCFRLGLIERVFPDARYVVIRRHALAVAGSIARLADEGRWFNGDKWPLLARLAEEWPETRGLAARCHTNLERGLLEWVLAVGSSMRSLAGVPAERVLHLRYEDFAARPEAILRTILAFAGLPADGVEEAPAVHPAPAAPEPGEPMGEGLAALLRAAHGLRLPPDCLPPARRARSPLAEGWRALRAALIRRHPAPR